MKKQKLILISFFFLFFNINPLLSSEENYFLIHVDCSVEKCEERDVKGLYKKARAGEIKNFTGIDSPYEVPENPNLIVNTEKESVDESVKKIFNAIKGKIN